jgi:hypothetical protein
MPSHSTGSQPSGAKSRSREISDAAIATPVDRCVKAGVRYREGAVKRGRRRRALQEYTHLPIARASQGTGPREGGPSRGSRPSIRPPASGQSRPGWLTRHNTVRNKREKTPTPIPGGMQASARKGGPKQSAPAHSASPALHRLLGRRDVPAPRMSRRFSAVGSGRGRGRALGRQRNAHGDRNGPDKVRPMRRALAEPCAPSMPPWPARERRR